MHFLFSGEGPTNLGTCSVTGDLCEGASFIYGPLTSIVDRLVQHRHGYSPLETGLCAYVPKAALVRCASELKSARKALGLPGKKRAKETRYFFNNARAMARIATERQKIVGDTAVAILFRDSDGTASAGRGLWDDKRRSMLDGFLEEGFSRGVPMLPKQNRKLGCYVRSRIATAAARSWKTARATTTRPIR